MLLSGRVPHVPLAQLVDKKERNREYIIQKNLWQFGMSSEIILSLGSLWWVVILVTLMPPESLSKKIATVK